MKQSFGAPRIQDVLAKVREAANARNRVRATFLRRLKDLNVFSTTLVPCLKGGEALPVDIEQIEVLAIALLEAAREEHRAMLADAEAQS